MKWWNLNDWQSDDVVDHLIANNVARPIPGMEKPDLEIIAKQGRIRWNEAVRAQERQSPDASSST